MNHSIRLSLLALLLIHGTAIGATVAEMDAEVDRPVDIAPWCYAWRADRAVQEQPEAYFIPRRLARIDSVYRTAASALPPDQLKSIFYNMPDLLRPLPAAPKGKLQSALLWSGGVVNSRIEIRWPENAGEIPPPDAVDVRIYPTSFGWFGWTVDRVLKSPKVSADGRTWVYETDPADQMDSSYSQRVPAATEMVAVFYDRDAAKQPAVPTIRVTSPAIGNWKRIDVDIEWGFSSVGDQKDFKPTIETSVARAGDAIPLTDGRHGIRVPLLYAPDSRLGLDSRLTLWNGDDDVTMRVADLNAGPIYIRARGLLITKTGADVSAKTFLAKLQQKNLKSISQLTREHAEASSWEQVMQQVRWWRCPPGTVASKLPEVPDPPMLVELPDANWTAAWRAASDQLRGKHMWGGLAFEVGRVAHEMDLVGLHEQADKVYETFIATPGAKSDGDYSDGNGAFEPPTSLRHDMGYSHNGTHASTGRMLFAMSERFFLTGDAEWFKRNRARLETAADWIIRQRTTYLSEVPHRDKLQIAGLMPPQMLGDYALPTCDWRWYYCDNAFALQGLARFADALEAIDPAAAAKYKTAASDFRHDLSEVIRRDAALSPVRLGRDGAYHTYLPRMAYARGLTGPELGAPQFPDCDRFMGALPLAEPFGAMDASDPRMVDTLELMEEMGSSPAATQELEAARKSKGVATDDAWFWNAHVRLPKASHNANIYLLQDDVPSFLRYWMNTSALMVGANGKFWEAWHPDDFTDCTDPDNGTAGWFLENFRNLLVMEDAGSLWLARATPRAWLAQGSTIKVKNAPTYFGAVNYQIVSDIDHGKIEATIDLPNRRPVKQVVLRLRHPASAEIKDVEVNGKPWLGIDRERETITLPGMTGTVKVVAHY